MFNEIKQIKMYKLYTIIFIKFLFITRIYCHIHNHFNSQLALLILSAGNENGIFEDNEGPLKINISNSNIITDDILSGNSYGVFEGHILYNKVPVKKSIVDIIPVLREIRDTGIKNNLDRETINNNINNKYIELYNKALYIYNNKFPPEISTDNNIDEKDLVFQLTGTRLINGNTDTKIYFDNSNEYNNFKDLASKKVDFLEISYTSIIKN